MRTGSGFGLGMWLFLALSLASVGPVRASSCSWYAGNDTPTLYERADAACKGYILKNGWNPPGYVYDSTHYWNAAAPTAGARCFLRYRPDIVPSNGPTNIYNAAVVSGDCTDVGLCATYPQNSSFGCGKTATDLESVAKSDVDPTRTFHQTQTCIARKSCDLRCKMENCKWMDRVIPDFVNPYLLKTGNWPAIEQACRDRGSGWWSDRRCAEAMARNHIFDDLIPALVRTGCGSDGDWELVYQTIEQCTGASLGSRLEQSASSGVVWVYRNAARAACQGSRALSGFPTDINADMRGRTCQQP